MWEVKYKIENIQNSRDRIQGGAFVKPDYGIFSGSDNDFSYYWGGNNEGSATYGEWMKSIQTLSGGTSFNWKTALCQ